MPAGFLGVLPSIIGGATTITAGVLGSRAQSQSSRRAVEATERANQEALQFERDNEARRREEFDRSEQMARQAWDAEQARLARLDERQIRLDELDEWRYRNEDARATRGENFQRQQYNARAPYRATGRAALNELARLAGLSVGEGDTVPLVPGGDTPPPPLATGISSGAPSPTPTTATLSQRAPIDLVNRPMTAGHPPEVDADGKIPVTISADAYRTLATPRRPTMTSLLERSA